MKTEAKGGVPASFERIALVRKPKKFRNGGSPSEGNKKNLTFNTCAVLLGLQIQVPTQDLFCERVRCTKAREKGEDTKLVVTKTWSMTRTTKDDGGANPSWAIMECPKCKKRTRHYLGAGGNKK